MRSWFLLFTVQLLCFSVLPAHLFSRLLLAWDSAPPLQPPGLLWSRSSSQEHTREVIVR